MLLCFWKGLFSIVDMTELNKRESDVQIEEPEDSKSALIGGGKPDYKKATLRSIAFNLANSTIGAGIFSIRCTLFWTVSSTSKNKQTVSIHEINSLLHSF